MSDVGWPPRKTISSSAPKLYDFAANLILLRASVQKRYLLLVAESLLHRILRTLPEACVLLYAWTEEKHQHKKKVVPFGKKSTFLQARGKQPAIDSQE